MGVFSTWALASMAHAGVPECGDIRLEDAGSCEVRGSLDCEAGCGEVGVYKKACATKLQTVCKEECVLDPEPTCTDECTEQCSADCDAGVNVICIHNCFGECSGRCEFDCAKATDQAQCVATCEANCDAECDTKCRPLVSGSCYTHCIECCGGACTAQANMTCQNTCQEKQFEECEYEFRVDCDASCSGDGALFCDGEYALAGTAIPACAQALLANGIEIANFELEAGLDGGIDTANKLGCAMSPPRPATPGRAAWSLGVLLAALGLRQRRAAPLRMKRRGQ